MYSSLHCNNQRKMFFYLAGTLFLNSTDHWLINTEHLSFNSITKEPFDITYNISNASLNFLHQFVVFFCKTTRIITGLKMKNITIRLISSAVHFDMHTWQISWKTHLVYHLSTFIQLFAFSSFFLGPSIYRSCRSPMSEFRNTVKAKKKQCF